MAYDSWLAIPAVRDRVSQRITGSDQEWIPYTLERHIGSLPADRMASIGCGTGWLERILSRNGAAHHIDAFDIDWAAIQAAKQRRDEVGLDGITYYVRDANDLRLDHTYDAIWFVDSLHHLTNLEHVLDEVARNLTPIMGRLILFEYVGPNRFQFPPRQRMHIQDFHRMLPDRYRRLGTPAPLSDEPGHPVVVYPETPRSLRRTASRVLDKTIDGSLVPAVLRTVERRRTGLKRDAALPTVRDVVAVDPSEAPRSADIMPLVRERFEIIEETGLCGGISQFLFAGLTNNFTDDQGVRLVDTLLGREEALTRQGEIGHDFAYVVARAR
jgi:SAM-dependent methyltransferase